MIAVTKAKAAFDMRKTNVKISKKKLKCDKTSS